MKFTSGIGLQRRRFASQSRQDPLLLLHFLAFVLVAWESRAQGGFVLQCGYISDIDTSGNINFTLRLNRAPDFFTSDEYGRQADAFQFYIGTTTNIPVFYPPRPYASLVRGGEIQYGNGLIIRNDGPPDDSDPNSGGWGSVRGTVPFSLNGALLQFSIPADVLNVQGPFAYSLILTSFGAETHDPYTGDSGGPIPVPEPGPVSFFFAVLAARSLLARRR
jgi:hypothetical protein